METIIEVPLCSDDLCLLDKWRGDYSREVYLVLLLRMVTSGTIEGGPEEPGISN